MPWSAISKIGASSSLFTATMVFEVCMPPGAGSPRDTQRDVHAAKPSYRSGPPGTGPGNSPSRQRHARRPPHRQRIGEFLDDAELVGAADATATRDDNARLGQLGRSPATTG